MYSLLVWKNLFFLLVFNFQEVNSDIYDRPRSSGSFVYKSYQTTVYCNPSTYIKFPKNVSEIQTIVKRAIRKGRNVKALGSRHSLTDLICTDGIPISMKNIDYAIDNEDGSFTFGAGIEVIEAMQFLQDRNRTLIHVPAYGGITIGGSIGTGAHGSSLLHPASISDQVVGLTIIDGTGAIRKISHPDDINAFRVHLGLLGIILDVTLETVPLFKMKVENKVESQSILFTGKALQWAKKYDYFQMWWFPSTTEVIVSKGIYIYNVSVPGNAHANLIPDETYDAISGGKQAYETLQILRARTGLFAFETFTGLSLYLHVIGKPPIYSEDGETLQNPATGYAWRLLSNKCTNKCAWDNGDQSVYPEESSVAFDISQLTHVTKAIKNILSKIPASFSMIGVLIRFSKESDALMAISSGRQTFTVEWATPMRNDPFRTSRDGIGAYQAILQTMVNEYGGRPHWGKNGMHYFMQEVLQKTTPNRYEFIKAMRKYDPNGLFLNKFGRRILGISDEVDKDPRVTRCALQDYCICKRPGDCAALQSCSTMNGYNVCKDLIQNEFPPIPSLFLSNFVAFLDFVGTWLANLPFPIYN